MICLKVPHELSFTYHPDPDPDPDPNRSFLIILFRLTNHRHGKRDLVKAHVHHW
jgi:hypothetical protein